MSAPLSLATPPNDFYSHETEWNYASIGNPHPSDTIVPQFASAERGFDGLPLIVTVIGVLLIGTFAIGDAITGGHLNFEFFSHLLRIL